MFMDKDDYLVDEETGERAVFYECDPEKNKECPKMFCRGEGGVGFCEKTTNPDYAKEGSRSWYAVKKQPEDGEPYWGREYIDSRWLCKPFPRCRSAFC